MRFAFVQFGDHRGDGSPYWNWRIMEGESPDDPQAVELTSHQLCLGFLRSNLISDTHGFTPTDTIRDHTRSLWRKARGQHTFTSPDDQDHLVAALPVLIPGLDGENIVVLPPR